MCPSILTKQYRQAKKAVKASCLSALVAKNLIAKNRKQPLQLSAGAMLYTVAICLLVAMVLTAMVLLFGYSKIASNQVYFKELAQDNLESGANLILYSHNADFGNYAGQLFDSPIDSYYLAMKPWGMYGILTAEGVHGPARARKSMLFGQRPRGNFAFNLVMEDRNRPLNLAGKTHLQGKLCLPSAGLKRGMVGRISYEGASLYQGNLVKPSDAIFAVDFRKCEAAADRLRQLKATQITGGWRCKPGDVLAGKWEQPTLELRSNAPIVLKDIHLSGNIVVTAPHVQIAATAQLEDIQIYAQAIHVQTGFEGRLQLFATDSIFIAPQCTLQYPSAAVLSSADEWGSLILSAESTLEGIVMADPSMLQPHLRPQSYVLIAPKAEVVGTVLVAENLDLQGTVTGNVTTGKFRLITAGAVYENYLLDATIQQEGLSPQYAMPLLQTDHPEYLEIRRLQ